MKKIITTITAFAVLLAVAVFAFTKFFPASKATAVDVRISSEWSFPDDAKGRTTPFARSVRIEKANGDWEDVVTYLDRGTGEPTGEVHKTFGIGGKGVFRLSKDGTQLLYLGERPAGYKPKFDASKLRTQEGFQGDTVMLGEPAIVRTDPTGEFTHAVNLNGAMLKQALSGGQTIQATSVEKGLFDLDALPDVPINYAAKTAKAQ